jgi:hypothetical protein
MEQVGRMIRALIKNFPQSDDAVREQEVLRT